MKKFIFILGWGIIFLFLGSIFSPGMTYAQTTYRWVDEKGRAHFTDNLQSIPKKYRIKYNAKKARNNRTYRKHTAQGKKYALPQYEKTRTEY